MALIDCIQRALQNRVITQRQARQIQGLIEHGQADERRILESFIQEAQDRRRRTNLQVIATKRNLSNISAHPEGTGKGVLALLTRDLKARAPYSNVDYRRKAILAELYGQMAEAMEAYRTKNLGFSQDRAGVKKMVMELFGQSTGDVDARSFARMWGETAETARMRMNVAGGQIPRRRDWGLPHIHEAKKIAAVPFEEWRDFIVPRLDRARMFNKFSLPMSRREFDDLLIGLYQEFRKAAGKTMTDTPRNVPNRPDHRLLTFRNGASWLEYNERFGEPDIYHAMMTHLDHMAGDIALMEILGPNPDAAMSQFKKMAAEAGTRFATMDTINKVYTVVTGRINQTDSERIANFGVALRNWLSSAQLGSAFVSSFSDVITTRHTLAFNGIPAVKAVKTWFNLMRPGSVEDRIFAVKLGLGAEGWITRALAASRFQEITGHGLSAKISDTVFRATLLSPWTDAGRHAFGMEFLGFIGENTGRVLRELPEALQSQFRRYGITERHWEIIRRTPVIEREGARYLRPADILELSRREAEELAEIFRGAGEDIQAELGLRGRREAALGRRLSEAERRAEAARGRVSLIQDAANRLQEMVLTEMDFAVPMPDARVKAITTQGQRRGSLLGEIARDVALYKQFPITMITTHLYRGAQALEGLQRVRYLAELMVGLTIMGAIAHQSKNVVKGRDSQDMTEPKFWLQALAQGGGGGIYGDFIMSDVNRFGKGFTMTLMGPVADLVDDMASLTLGNLQQVLKGQETRFMAEGIMFAKRYTPGTNAWYARLALERLFWDQLLAMADPEAHQGFRRIMQRARKDYDQEFWWQPGEGLPERLPELAPAFGK